MSAREAHVEAVAKVLDEGDVYALVKAATKTLEMLDAVGCEDQYHGKGELREALAPFRAPVENGGEATSTIPGGGEVGASNPDPVSASPVVDRDGIEEAIEAAARRYDPYAFERAESADYAEFRVKARDGVRPLVHAAAPVIVKAERDRIAAGIEGERLTDPDPDDTYSEAHNRALDIALAVVNNTTEGEESLRGQNEQEARDVS